MKSPLGRPFLLASAALSIGVMASPATAQDAQTTLNEVVVTARRMQERLQDVPISITVFNQEELRQRNITYAADLATYTPSLSASSQFGQNNTTFAIRGFSQQAQTSPTVGVYFADVVAPRGGNIVPSGEGAGPGDFFDLENVQVLKGPQGTLFGRNTTGGAILLVPRKPTDRFEGYLEGSGGDYGMRRLQGVVNAPVNDKVRVRLGFDRQTRDGYLNNISGIGPADFNNINYFAARASVVVDLTPSLENYTILNYTKSETHGVGTQTITCNPATLFGSLACTQLAASQGHGAYAVGNNLSDAQSRLEESQFINTTTWEANKSLTVKNIVSYSLIRDKLRTDLFGDNWMLPKAFGPLGGTPIIFSWVNSPPGRDISNQSTFTEELQFQGRALDERLTWQGGGYMEYSRPQGEAGVISPVLINCANVYALQCFDAVGALAGAQGTVGQVGIHNAAITFRNLAIYGQATYQLTDQFKLTGGLRYTSDRTRADSVLLNYRFPAPNTPVPSCQSIFTTLERGCAQQFEQSSSAPTWLIDLDYTPRQGILAYAKYARGYRQGDIAPFGADGYTSFGPEHVDNYEVGAKTSFNAPVPGTFDVAAFYNNFKDQQIQVGFTGPTATPNVGVVNAGKSRILGVEVTASVSPVHGLNLAAAYTYLNSKLETLEPIVLVPGSGYTQVQFSAIPGDPLPYTPKHKATVSIDYTLPIQEAIGKITVGANYVYTDPEQILSGSPWGNLPAHGLLNLHLDWNSVASRPVDVSFFMTNATNKFYWTGVTDLYQQLGFVTRTLAEPRMFGFRLRARFGS
jgi:iron complex outermembrane receptor protein